VVGRRLDAHEWNEHPREQDVVVNTFGEQPSGVTFQIIGVPENDGAFIVQNFDADAMTRLVGVEPRTTP